MKIRNINRIIWIIIYLNLIDFLCTYYGLKKGIILERNPFLNILYKINPCFFIVYKIIVVTGILLVINKLLVKLKNMLFIKLAIIFIFAGYVIILILHMYWLNNFVQFNL